MTTQVARTFTSAEVCKLAHLTYRQLDYAVRHDVLSPGRDHDPAPGWPDHGSGNYRRWTEADAIKAVELSRMLRAGISWARAAELLAAGYTATLQVTPLPEGLP
jgi:DNA-binding transcriptional MerR regulator